MTQKAETFKRHQLERIERAHALRRRWILGGLLAVAAVTALVGIGTSMSARPAASDPEAETTSVTVAMERTPPTPDDHSNIYYEAALDVVVEDVARLSERWSALWTDCAREQPTRKDGAHPTQMFSGLRVDISGRVERTSSDASESRAASPIIEGWSEGCDRRLERIVRRTAHLIRQYDSIYGDYGSHTRRSGQPSVARVRDLPPPEPNTSGVRGPDIVATLDGPAPAP